MPRTWPHLAPDGEEKDILSPTDTHYDYAPLYAHV